MSDTYYVATDGDDGTGAVNDPYSPYATFAAVAALIANGDTISIAPGTYTQQFPATMAAKTNLTISGDGRTSTIIKLPNTGAAGWTPNGVTLYPILVAGAGWTVQDLKLWVPDTVTENYTHSLCAGADAKDGVTFRHVNMIADHTSSYSGGQWIKSAGGSYGLMMSVIGDIFPNGFTVGGECLNTTIDDCEISAGEYGCVIFGSGTITDLVMSPLHWGICGTNGLVVGTPDEADHATNTWSIDGVTYRQTTTANRNVSATISAVVTYYSDLTIANVLVDLPQDNGVAAEHNGMIIVGGSANTVTVTADNCIIRSKEHGGTIDIYGTGMFEMAWNLDWDATVPAATDVRINTPRWTGATGADVGSMTGGRRRRGALR